MYLMVPNFVEYNAKDVPYYQVNIHILKIPIKYVTDAFIVVLFIEDGQISEQNLFCFFESQIRREWKTNKQNEYTLSFSKSNYKEMLKNNVFNSESVNEIINSIININVKGEFKTMGHGYAEPTLSPLIINGSGHAD